MALPASLYPSSRSQAKLISIRDLNAHCSTCGMRQLCLPFGLDADAMRELDAVVTDRIPLKKGQRLYRRGEPFAALYAIRRGSCKTVLIDDAHEQITGYHMPGEVIGLDGIGTERHGCAAIALEETEVCALPFDRLEELARNIAPLQRNLHQFLSREIERDQNMMLLLGSMRAEERLAAFLLNLSDRYGRRGNSATEIVLRMTREEIGSYLGLTLETVSRLFSRFRDDGLLQVRGRALKLLDLSAIKQLAGQHC